MAIYDDTITENLTASDAWLLGIFGLIIENLQVDEGLVSTALVRIIEKIEAQENMYPGCIFNKEIIDKAEMEEIFYILYPIVVSDALTLADQPIEFALRLADLIETMRASDDPSTQATFNSALVMSMVIADFALMAKSAVILERMDLSETLVDLFLTSAIIIDQIEATLIGQEFLLLGAIVSEDIGLDDTISLSSLLHSEVLEHVEFVGAMQADEFYNTYSFNPEGYALTTYSNFAFNSVASFNGKYLMANSSGLYELGGETDDLAEIVATITTSAMDMGTTNRKQIKKMYLGLTNDGTLILRVKVDGKGDFFYILESRTVGLDTQAIKVGKGLVGRYWQFKLITTENSSLEIDNMEFLPVEFRRKI